MRKTKFRQFFPGTVALGLVLNGYAAEVTTSPQELLARSFELTAKGNLEAADANYRELVRVAPEDGYPALARFLSRTGQTTRVAELISSDGFRRQPPVIRARALINAGQRQQAIAELKQDSDSSSGTLYGRSLLLSNQLEAMGETDAAAAAVETALQSPALLDTERRDLFARLLKIAGPEQLAEKFSALLESAVSSSKISYPQVREMAMDGLAVLSAGADYAGFHARLEDKATSAPTQAWLLSLSYLKKGEEGRAVAVLDSVDTATLTRRQRGLILEEKARLALQDPSRAMALYTELLQVTDDPAPIKLKLAQQHFRNKDFAQVTALLKTLDFDELPEEEHQTAMNLYLTSLGAAGAVTELPAEFTRLAADLPYEKVRDLSAAPFLLFPVEQVEPLRAELGKSAGETSGSGNLLVLSMALENQVGNADGVAKALAAYCEQNPGDVNAAQELAETLAATAWQTVAENPNTSPPLQQLERVADAASKALWKVIRLRPYAPEPYIQLMSLYTLYNQPEKAREVPRFLSDRPNATAEEIHLAGYIYATQEHPELALPLYERALAMKDDPRFRINYAAALGRVGRADEALKIYRDIIKNGVNGHQYSIESVHLNALQLAQRSGLGQQHVDFLLGLMNDPSVVERKAFLLGEGGVLTTVGYAREALKFFHKYKEEFPGDAVTAVDAIVGTYVEMKDFDTARSMLSAEIKKTTETRDLALLRNNLAITFVLEGQVDHAVAEWQKLAEDLPREREATRGLLNAASALEKVGKLNRSREVLKQYLALNTGDVYGEQVARDELARVDRLDVPAQRLLDSAIMEYAPDKK